MSTFLNTLSALFEAAMIVVFFGSSAHTDRPMVHTLFGLLILYFACKLMVSLHNLGVI